MDALDSARARYPVGSRLTARVVHIPEPLGVVGVFVEADEPPTGFVDVTWLPRDPAAWPRLGDQSEFEVLQHRGEQMRLWPADPAWRGRTHWLENDAEWSAIRQALHVGDVVPGRVTEVFTTTRECFVDLGVTTAVAEWSGDAPTAGERQVVVTAILDTTRRVLIDLA